MEKRILSLKLFGRPIVFTEYLARPLGSTFEAMLLLFWKYNVGACHWGLVQRKSQTHCAWDSWQRTYAKEPERWFHDILRKNSESYDPKEFEFLKAFSYHQTKRQEKVA